ncbi:MAG: YggS family pyridoxal phosphate-dependent enzyme [Phycisphaerae bacterium]|nr:YggS family pyridoxal phosphate-dependent enzyme [Phycisphaerae bacterium]
MNTIRRKLAENLKRLHDRVRGACERKGRRFEDVRLIAVTKMVEIDIIRTAIEMGLADLGENRVQELIKRASMVREHLARRRRMEGPGTPAEPQWHMIGHLQRNKVRALLPWTDCIHSLDSLRLAEEISAEAVKIGKVIPLLIEINVSGEKSKGGMAVGAISHCVELLRALPGIRITGLMTMAPLVDDPEEARPHFARLRELLDDLRCERLVAPDCRELSMGMSNDFEIAIEEGATMVRVGRVLFEGVTP